LLQVRAGLGGCLTRFPPQVPMMPAATLPGEAERTGPITPTAINHPAALDADPVVNDHRLGNRKVTAAALWAPKHRRLLFGL
jgi:hypothetical protein